MGKIEGPVYPGECFAVASALHFCTLPAKREQLSKDFMVFAKKAEQSVPYSFSRDEFVQFLMRSYFLLPDGKEAADESVDRHRVFGMKKTILETAIPYWRIPTDEESSIQAFRFFIAAHSPLSSQFNRAKWESDYEELARGRTVFKEEKDLIEALMRENIKYWGVRDLNAWILQPFVPEEISNILILARARSGHKDLAEQDIANAEFLGPFDLERRSAAAKGLAARKLNEVAEWDKKVEKLRVEFEEMRRGIENSREEEDEFLFKDIVIEYDKWPAGMKMALAVTVILNSKATRGEITNIFEGTKNDITDWRKEITALDQSEKPFGVYLAVKQENAVVKQAFI